MCECSCSAGLVFFVRTHDETPTSEELVGMFLIGLNQKVILKAMQLFLISMGYLAQTLTRHLQKHDSRVTNKPLKTLQQVFPSPKYRPSIEGQPNVIYKLPCKNCDRDWSYMGGTGKCLQTRQKEHLRNVRSHHVTEG